MSRVGKADDIDNAPEIVNCRMTVAVASATRVLGPRRLEPHVIVEMIDLPGVESPQAKDFRPPQSLLMSVFAQADAGSVAL